MKLSIGKNLQGFKISFLIFLIFLSGCVQNLNNENLEQSSELRKLTFNEVSTHNKPEDCWIIINRKVYDVSGYGQKHPGGEIIYSYCGKDATSVFQSKPTNGLPHSNKAIDILAKFYVGDFN